MDRTNKNKQSSYLDEVFGQKDKYCEEISRQSQKSGVGRMQISSHEGSILQFLVKLSKSKKIVEIGTLYAYSTLHMAQALPENGQIFTLDISQERHKKSQDILKTSEDFKKIHWICGRALETLSSIENQGPFDMIFIDADKEAYLDYLDWAEKHLRQGGLVVADNTFLFGNVYGESEDSWSKKTVEKMREFNKKISNSAHWKGTLIPTVEGLSVAIKK